MLASALSEYEQQQRLTALALNEALRYGPRGSQFIAQRVQVYQAAAIRLSLQTLGAILDEQAIDAPAESSVLTTSLLTGTQATVTMLDSASSSTAFSQLVQTLVRDAGRTARAVDMGMRPALTGYVRALRAPSCGRCVVLAGRVYRYSQGFQRHPRCDCQMTPTTLDVGPELVTDPQAAFESGQIRGLSKADTEALGKGADLSQVVNVRRRAAGLTVGSSVMVRAGRLTPQACLMFADDRAGATALLRRFGYIT